MSAITFPVSLPPYHLDIVKIETRWRREVLTACTNALTDKIQGMATGVPDCITTTVEGFAAETAEIRASM